MDDKKEDDFDPKIIAKVTLNIAGFESEDEVKALIAAILMACIAHGLRLGQSEVELAIPKDMKKEVKNPLADIIKKFDKKEHMN